jgi:DNA-binding beta-propeller fold protein YncE
MAYVSNQDSGTVTPVFTATRTAGASIRVAKAPDALAAGPGGRVVYAVSTNFGSSAGHGFVTPIRTATSSAGRSIAVGDLADGIAITPDGRTAWIVDYTTVTPVDTATGRAGRPVSVVQGDGDHANALVITPDGARAYVATSFTVVPVDLATRHAGRAIPLRNPAWVLTAMAITPDGKTVYVLTGGQDVVPINTRTNTAGRHIRVAGGATAIAVSPGGKTAYVGSVTGNVPGLVSAVYPIIISAGKTAAPIKLGRPSLDSVVNSIAITPDGKAAYVATNNAVYPIDTATNTAGKPISIAPANFTPVVVAISPDGKTAWVVSVNDKSGAGLLTPISIPANHVGRPIHVGNNPVCLLLTTGRPRSTPRQSQCATFLR